MDTPAFDALLTTLLAAHPQDLQALHEGLQQLEEQCRAEGSAEAHAHTLILFAQERLAKAVIKEKNIKKQVRDYERKHTEALTDPQSIYADIRVHRLGELRDEAREQLAKVYSLLSYQLRDQRFNYDTGSLSEEEKFLIRARASAAHVQAGLSDEARFFAMDLKQRARKKSNDRYREKKQAEKLALRAAALKPDTSRD